MNLDVLHRLVRQLASDDAPTASVSDSAKLSEAERQAVRGLRRRLREVGGFATLVPVSGTTIWAAPPRARVAQ